MLKRLWQRWKDWWEEQEREMLLTSTPGLPKFAEADKPKCHTQMTTDLNRKIEKLQTLADRAAERRDLELAEQLRAEIPSYRTALEMAQQKLEELRQESERIERDRKK